MNLDFLKGNPALNDISPEKLQFLMDFASNNTDAKDAKSMASTVMNAANNAKQNGMTFSNTETTLLIELLNSIVDYTNNTELEQDVKVITQKHNELAETVNELKTKVETYSNKINELEQRVQQLENSSQS